MPLLRQLVVQFVGDSDDLDKTMKSVNKSLDDFGASAIKFGTVVTAAFGGALEFAVKQSSDLAESINKAEVVFGESKAIILDWRKNAATSMALSRSAALEAAAGF